MMTVMVVRGVTLDGASLGIEYYLNPDFNRLSDSIVRDIFNFKCFK